MIRNSERVQKQRKKHIYYTQNVLFIINNTRRIYEQRPHVTDKGEVLVSKLPPRGALSFWGFSILLKGTLAAL